MTELVLFGQTQGSCGMFSLGAVWNLPVESFEQLAGQTCLKQEFGLETSRGPFLA